MTYEIFEVEEINTNIFVRVNITYRDWKTLWLSKKTKIFHLSNSMFMTSAFWDYVGSDDMKYCPNLNRTVDYFLRLRSNANRQRT